MTFLSFLFSVRRFAFLVAILLPLFDVSAIAETESTYRLNTGDKLRIDIWQEENLRAEVMILPDGMLNFPLVGTVPAAGKTTSELAELLKQKLADFIPGPEVHVALVTLEGNVVYVIGEVIKPGPYIMSKNVNIVQALSMAGGLTPFAAKNDIHVIRTDAKNHTVSIPFRYDDVEDGDALDSIIQLQSGDTVIVP